MSVLKREVLLISCFVSISSWKRWLFFPKHAVCCKSSACKPSDTAAFVEIVRHLFLRVVDDVLFWWTFGYNSLSPLQFISAPVDSWVPSFEVCCKAKKSQPAGSFVFKEQKQSKKKKNPLWILFWDKNFIFLKYSEVPVAKFRSLLRVV